MTDKTSRAITTNKKQQNNNNKTTTTTKQQQQQTQTNTRGNEYIHDRLDETEPKQNNPR